MKLVFPNGGHVRALLNPGVNSIGSAIHNTFVLRAPAMPALAAEIHVMGRYVHLVPRAGAEVLINGCKASDLVPLQDGDRLQIAGVSANVVLVTEEALLGDADTVRPVANAELSTRPVAMLPTYFLHGLTGDIFGKLYALPRIVVVGRSPECDFILSMPDISRRHAALRPSASGVLVGDLGSSNGVYINDRKIQHGILFVGDELRLASHRLLLCAPEAPSLVRAHQASGSTPRKSA